MLTVYTLEQSEQWDAAVRSFCEYDTYWLSGYVKAFEIHGDGTPLLFYYEGENLRGINVVMKRDVSKDSHFKGKLAPDTYFDFATPYGYGGWLIEGANKEELFLAYEAWCREHSVISEFVRFHPVLKNHEYSVDHYDVVPLGLTVSIDLSSPETIWENFTSKNRNVIRKAQKNGVMIRRGNSIELYEAFREIYNQTMDKDEADSYYYFSPAFYESVCKDLSQHAQLFYAELDGKMIAASIMLFTNGRMNYHLSGSLREYSSLAPTNLLLYEAALWGCENGLKTLYLGGGVGSGEDSLFKFKKSFYRGEELPQFYIGKKILNQEKYEELLGKRDVLPDSGFFPKYRA